MTWRDPHEDANCRQKERNKEDKQNVLLISLHGNSNEWLKHTETGKYLQPEFQLSMNNKSCWLQNTEHVSCHPF